MSLADAWTDATRRVVAEAVDSVPRGTGGFQAQVVAVTPRTGLTSLVSIKWQGKQIDNVVYDVAYTPAVGHQVAVLLFDTDPFILGRIGGGPSF